MNKKSRKSEFLICDDSKRRSVVGAHRELFKMVTFFSSTLIMADGSRFFIEAKSLRCLTGISTVFTNENCRI